VEQAERPFDGGVKSDAISPETLIERTDRAIDHAAEATLLLDAGGMIRFANRAAEALFGYTAADLAGTPLEALLGERAQAQYRRYRAAMVVAPPHHQQFARLSLNGRDRDGATVPLDVSLKPVAPTGELLVIVRARAGVRTRRENRAVHRMARSRHLAEAADRELRALQSVTDVALTTLPLDALLPELLRRIVQILSVDNAAILLLEADGQTLTVRAAQGPEQAVAADVRVPLGEGFAGRIAATRQPLVVEDISTYPLVTPFLRTFLRSIAGVPLLVGPLLVGVCHVGSSVRRRFTPGEIHLLSQVADRAACAIERARLLATEQTARHEAEAAQARMEAVMRAVPDSLAVYDTAGRVVMANPAYHAVAEQFMRSASSAQSLRERVAAVGGLYDAKSRLMPEDTWPQMRALRGEVVANAQAVEYTVRAPDVASNMTPTERVFSMTAAPLRDAYGRITGAVTVARDITERKQAEARLHASEQRLRLFVEHAPAAIAMLDRQMRYMVVSNMWSQGYHLPSPDVLIGRSHYDVFPDLPERWRAVHQRCLAGAVERNDDDRFERADGTAQLLRWEVRPWYERPNEIGGVILFVEDITDQKRLERERELAAAREMTAEGVARHLDQFFAIAAHDIRGPVMVLDGQIEFAARQAEEIWAALLSWLDDSPHSLPAAAASEPGERPAERVIAPEDIAASAGDLVSHLQETEGSATRLRSLVTKLFDVARARSGALTVRVAPVDLADLVRRQVAEQQLITPRRPLGVDLPAVAASALADADRLGQVLSNFLANAVKYSANETPVTVRLEVEQGRAVVSVVDHGPGLSEREQQDIWKLFHRAPGIEAQSATDGLSQHSLGLGLAICKQLIELHPGGRIGVESVVGVGSTFWFSLPLAPSAAISS